MSASDAVDVRVYAPERDVAELRACFVALQEFERTLDPAMPPGDAIADGYLALMLGRCASWDGTVFVATLEGKVVGFVCVWARVPPEPDEPPVPYAFVSDIVVLPHVRRRGIGRRLLATAEDYARSHGSATMKLDVMADNGVARRLYAASGFSTRRLELTKPLR